MSHLDPNDLELTSRLLATGSYIILALRVRKVIFVSNTLSLLLHRLTINRSFASFTTSPQ